MPFSKRKFSDDEISRCIQQAIKTMPSVVQNEYSLRPHKSLWFQVAMTLLQSEHAEETVVHTLASNLYKRFVKTEGFQKLYQFAKQSALKTSHELDSEDLPSYPEPTPFAFDNGNGDNNATTKARSDDHDNDVPDIDDCSSSADLQSDIVSKGGPGIDDRPPQDEPKSDAFDHGVPDIRDQSPNDQREDSPFTPPNEVFCICLKSNDGKPYLRCDVCNQWYHFECVGLSTSPDTTEKVQNSPFVCAKCRPPVSRGIVNIGNSCWLAATVQAVNVTHIGEILKKRPITLDYVDEAIKGLLNELEEDTRAPVDETIVRNVVHAISRDMGGAFQNATEQQDASEFFSWVINLALEKQQILGGVSSVTSIDTTEVVTCLNCGNEERKANSLKMLTVVPDGSDTVDSITSLFNEEVRPNVRCSHCKTNQSKSFISIVEELPSCLVLLVNRTRAGGRKSSAKQRSLQVLEIADLQVGLSQRRYLNYTYNLTSAVVHKGVDCKGGHYYAYVFDSNGTVLVYDDSTVKRRNADSALKDIECNGCLLFYHLSIGTHDQREDEPAHDDDDIGVQQTTQSRIYGDESDTQDLDHPMGSGQRVQDNSPHGPPSHSSPKFKHAGTDESLAADRHHDDDVHLSEATLSHLASAQLFTKYFEAEIPKYAWFQIDSDIWKDLRRRQKGTTLPLQWVNVFYDGLKRSNPYCTLMFRRHRASKLRSRKLSGVLLSAEAYCSRRPTCTVNATIRMGHDLRCNVEYTGQIKHKTDEAAQRPIRADERAKLQEDLARDHCPSRLHSERLRQMDPTVFASGNLTGVGVDGTVFKQISYEGRRQLQSDSDLITSLLTKEETTLKSYIRQVSVRPMYVVAFTDAGVRLFHELARTVPIHWDATGTVAWKEGKKEYLYYAIVLPNPTQQLMKLKSSPCPIAELVTTNQSEPTITNWLQLIRYREKQIYGYDKVTVPCMIVSDRSLPLLIASLKVFAGETLREFMERSWRIVNGRASETDLNGLIIHSGLSHFMKDCKDYCKKYYRKEHQWFAITLFRLLAAFNRLAEVRRLFYSICIVLRAEYHSPLCRVHLDRIFDETKKYFPAEHRSVEHLEDSASAEEDTTDPAPREHVTKLTEEDALLQQASSFKELVLDLDAKAKRSLRQESARLDPAQPSECNKLRGDQLLDKMLKYLLPTLPVWSNLLIGDLTRHSPKYNNFMYVKKRFFIQNPPKTQGYMEAYNKIFKESALSRFRYRLDVLLEKMYASVLSQQRKFVIQYKVAKPKRASRKATTLIQENWSRTPRETTKRMQQTSFESLFKGRGQKLSGSIIGEKRDHRKTNKQKQNIKDPQTPSAGAKPQTRKVLNMEHDIPKSSKQPKSTKEREFGSTEVKKRKGELPAQDSLSLKKETVTNIKQQKPSYVQSDPPPLINQNYKEKRGIKMNTNATYEKTLGDKKGDTQPSPNEEQPSSPTDVLDEPIVVDDVDHTIDREPDKYETLLGEGTWLNDNVVNDYMCYLQTQVSNFEIFVCTSFHTVSNVSESEQVRRWYKNQKMADCRWVVFPVNDDGLHWVFIAANIVKKKVYLLDPLRDRRTSEEMRRFIRFTEQRSAMEGKPFILKSWPVVTTSKANFPFQSTSDDCGLFILLYARALILGENIPDYVDIRAERVRIYNELHEYDGHMP